MIFCANKKLIHRNEETKTSYYLCSYNSKSQMRDDTWYKHSSDVVMKSKVRKGIFKKQFDISEFIFKFYTQKELPNYTYEQFKIDLVVMLDFPKYMAIIAERPPRPTRKKTQQEIDDENYAMMVAASCVSTAFL
jgi:hypothetical protein